MHIGINAQLLSFSQSYRNGGISRYIRYLLTELARQPGVHRYTIFVNGSEVVERLGIRHPQLTFVAAAWSEARPVTRIMWEQMTLPGLIREGGIQVLHAPANVLPERLPRECAGVVTLHDLAFLRLPEVLTRPKRMYHRTFTVRSLRRASRIIAVSESTRRDASELLGIEAERIATVYPCVDERFTRGVDERVVREFRERRSLGEDFILYLGTLEPRKNILVLLEAYARLRQMEGKRVKLVLAGGKGWLYDEIYARVRELGLTEEVLFPGFVEEQELPLWYRAAAVFAYPSLYEGFGMPVTEALACGVPVITSSISSLPEAGAGIAQLVEPHDVDALALAVHRALNDPAIGERSRAQAASVSERFSAAGMLRQTLTVYEQAVTAHVVPGNVGSATRTSIDESKIGYGSIREQQ